MRAFFFIGAAMTGTIATIPKYQFLDSLGVPLVNGTLTTYLTGTTTLTSTWQDQALSSLNTNPIVLDARGEATLWLDSAIVYKFVLANEAGAIQWTQENISGNNSGSIILRADLAASSGSALVGFTQSVSGSIVRTVEAKLRQHKTLEDFGAVADGTASGGTDNWLAIENAIKFSASSGEAVYVTGKYYTSKPLNFNSVSGAQRHNVKFIGSGKPDVFNATGSIFYVGSGNRFACVEVIDSYHCNLIGIGFVGVMGTSVGIVASRGTFNGGPGHHLIRDCMVYVTSTLSTNSDVGSIGILNVACEETVVDNSDFWAAIPAAHAHLNSVDIVNVDAGGLPLNTLKSFVYGSYYSVPLVSVSSSNTVFKYTGQGRFIALNYQGPNVYIETLADLDLGHTFMQRVADPANPSAPQGTYHYGFQILSLWGLSWTGTIEHCDSMALIRGEMDYVNIVCTLGSESTILAELVFLEPVAGDRPILNNNITIRGIVDKAPVKCVRNIATSLPCLFKLISTTLKTSSTLQQSTADTGFWNMLAIAKSSKIVFYEKELICDVGIFKFDKNIIHSSSNVLFDSYMPDTGATGSFYLSAKADCATKNIVSSQSAGAGSIYTSAVEWVGANQNTGFGPYFALKETSGASVNFIPSTSNLTALVPTEVTTGGSGKCSFILTPTISGSSVQPLITKATVTVQADRVDGHTIIIF